MAVQTHVQHLRGNTARNDAFTGEAGEFTVNTDSHSLRIHDGTKQGGYGTVGVMHFDVLPATVPNDLHDGALVTSGTGPLDGIDYDLLVQKVLALEAVVATIVAAKEVASYDTLPSAVPADLSDDALVVTGTGPLA